MGIWIHSGEAIERELLNKLTVEPYELEDIDFKRVGVTDKQKRDFKKLSQIPIKKP